MKTSILCTADGMLIVAEQWGATTADLVAKGAMQLTRSEILSRFGQTKPVEDQRLSGEVYEYSEIFIFGKIGSIEVRLLVRDPNSLERYRVKEQLGWIYCSFARGRFSEVSVLIDGAWAPVDMVIP